MSDHHLKKISETLDSLEKELSKKSSTSSDSSNESAKNIDYTQNEAVLTEHASLQDKLSHQTSNRKLFSWLINPIRKKLYKEVDNRYNAAMNSQEVFNKHCLKELQALRKEIQQLKKN